MLYIQIVGEHSEQRNAGQKLTLTFILLHKLKQHVLLATLPHFLATGSDEKFHQRFEEICAKACFQGNLKAIFQSLSCVCKSQYPTLYYYLYYTSNLYIITLI